MLDSLRYLRLSKEEKRQEAITAYLDDVLSPNERDRFERQMAAEPALRADVEAQQQIKFQLRQLPRQAAPRNFTLDPAVYGKPEQANAFVLYPILRGATVMAGLLFIVALTAQLLFGSQNLIGLSSSAPSAEFSLEMADDSFEAESERAVRELALDENASGADIEEAPVAAPESEVVVEETAEEEVIEEQEVATALLEAEEPAEEAMAEEMIITAEIEAEEIEMPVEDSAAGDIAAASPPLGESEQDRAVAADGSSLATARPQPTAPATTDMDLALRVTIPAQELPTLQALATAKTQEVETAEGLIDQEMAEATDDVLLDPFQSLPILIIVLGVIALLLAGITLLTRRRL